jgi:hypothetical protein
MPRRHTVHVDAEVDHHARPAANRPPMPTGREAIHCSTFLAGDTNVLDQVGRSSRGCHRWSRVARWLLKPMPRGSG